MLGRAPFKHDLMRRYNIAFGTMFNDIHITRENPGEATAQTIKVPLSYSRKNKLIARVMGDPDIDRRAAMLLPRIGFELERIRYSAERQLPPDHRNIVSRDVDAGIYKDLMQPAPYDLIYKVYIMATYQEDAAQIVEQILPYFTPSFPLTMELIPEMGVILDTPVTLEDVDCTDKYDGAYQDRRPIIWTLTFTLTGYLFGPIRRHPLIKFANISFYVSKDDDLFDSIGKIAPIDRVTVQPGQDANGHPTTRLDRTVPYSQIEADEEWDYVVVIAGNLDPSEGTGGE